MMRIRAHKLTKTFYLKPDRHYASLGDFFSFTSVKIHSVPVLNEVDLELKAGESIGLQGSNGAGKTTLLRIFSRILKPDSGYFELKGQVSALIGSGTGFHQELSGRENIWLSGSLLGLKPQKIREAMDAIIDFSGTKNFIDQPLKYWSSGMQMRLGFAIASHLDSEILLLDEVLAVGDAEFQIKCLQKLDFMLKKEGRSSILVSHDPVLLKKFCHRILRLEAGKLREENDPHTSFV